MNSSKFVDKKIEKKIWETIEKKKESYVKQELSCARSSSIVSIVVSWYWGCESSKWSWWHESSQFRQDVSDKLLKTKQKVVKKISLKWEKENGGGEKKRKVKEQPNQRIADKQNAIIVQIIARGYNYTMLVTQCSASFEWLYKAFGQSRIIIRTHFQKQSR